MVNTNGSCHGEYEDNRQQRFSSALELAMVVGWDAVDPESIPAAMEVHPNNAAIGNDARFQ